MIWVKGICFSYRNKMVLRDVSMEIPQGEIVALLGESGSGKSTLAKVLTGILKPQAGRVEMDGKLLVHPERAYDRSLGLGIQMVHQHPQLSLDPRQRILDGMLEIVRYHHMADKGGEMDLVLKTTRSVALDTQTLNQFPSQISGGEAQRVSIAKALLFSPRLLILDEATSMLDVSTQANVLGLARRVQEENGGSILLITHDLELAHGYAGSTYIIENKTIRREI